MPLNHYVTLGRSGLRVSPLCLGGMTFGEDLGWGSSVKDSESIIAKYLELGGNFIDTANLYTFGHSETIIGDYFARTPGARDRVVLATKFYSNMNPGDPNGGGAGRKSIVQAVHESLRRLKTESIDLLWMHAWDRHTPIEETMRALDDLVASGKVRYLGFSDTPAWKVAQAQTIATLRGWSPLIALQLEYSLLERTVEGELLPMAQELGLGVTPWSPLRGGVLSGKHTRENLGKSTSDRPGGVRLTEVELTVIDALLAVAKELDTTPARIALAWVQGRPGVTSTIIGARTLQQLEQNVASVDVKLNPAQRTKLDDLTKPQLNFPARFLSRAAAIMHPGLTVNGDTGALLPFLPTAQSKTW